MRWLYLGIVAAMIAIPYVLMSEHDAGKVFDSKCKQLGGEPYHTRDGAVCLRANSFIEVK